MKTLERTPLTQPQPAAIEPAPITYGLDYYKCTMSQLAYVQEPDAEVTFTLHNRGSQRLMDYIEPDELQANFDRIQARGWSSSELEFLGGITLSDGRPTFRPQYLDYLATSELPHVHVRHDPATNDLAIETTGPAPLVTFWETRVMADVSETYFANYMKAEGIDPAVVGAEGDRRLGEFTSTMLAHPDIKFSDFGTRRRFSLDQHRHVVRELIAKCSDNLIGTSNVGLAQELGIKPSGTSAHEEHMIYAGLADARSQGNAAAIRNSHNRFLQDWYRLYGRDYSIALTDTFTTDFFFKDFTAQQAAEWKGCRQDSGDPAEFGERLIEFYKRNGVDPTTKTVVFSDSLNASKVVELHDRFKGRIHDVYGIGTSLTNNLGITALNIVMKATHVFDPRIGRGADTVKLSDNPGKHTGPADKVHQYQGIFGV